MPPLTVARSLVFDMASYLQGQGVNAAAIFAAAHIDPDATDGRVSGAQMAAFWRAAIDATGDEDLGLHASVAANPGALDIVGYVMLSSDTALDALRRGARLMRLLNDGLEFRLQATEHEMRCELRILGDGQDPMWSERRQVIETVLVGVVHQIRLLTGRDVNPLDVTMQHAAPASGIHEHERLFGVRPQFDAEADVVTLRMVDLTGTLRSANPVLLASFTAHADAALAALGVSRGLSGQVASEILARLKGEVPEVDDVARALAMSVRSLQRGLAAESTSFQRVLDSVRRELAIQHLASPDATVAKVAWLVGFSEPSAFHRAYKRWMGRSPRQQ